MTFLKWNMVYLRMRMIMKQQFIKIKCWFLITIMKYRQNLWRKEFPMRICLMKTKNAMRKILLRMA